MVGRVARRAMPVMKPLSECLLYTFVDTAYLHGRKPQDVARQLCDGGSDLVQFRAKNASSEEIQRLAELILPVTRSAGIGLVINDDLAAARAVGAEFCHLGQEDFFDRGYSHVSELFEAGAPVGRVPARGVRVSPSPQRDHCSLGLSSHAPPQAERAVAAGAAYIAVGPVYATATKPGATPVTLDYVRWAAKHVTVPWFAIGGVNLLNLDQVLGAGATRICVVSAILKANDVAEACQAFKDRLLSAR